MYLQQSSLKALQVSLDVFMPKVKVEDVQFDCCVPHVGQILLPGGENSKTRLIDL